MHCFRSTFAPPRDQAIRQADISFFTLLLQLLCPFIFVFVYCEPSFPFGTSATRWSFISRAPASHQRCDAIAGPHAGSLLYQLNRANQFILKQESGVVFCMCFFLCVRAAGCWWLVSRPQTGGRALCALMKHARCRWDGSGGARALAASHMMR